MTTEVTQSKRTGCPHTSLHGVELEHSRGYDSRRANVIGPDVWECDGCLTLQVEDHVGLLDSHGRDLRASIAALREALSEIRDMPSPASEAANIALRMRAVAAKALGQS